MVYRTFIDHRSDSPAIIETVDPVDPIARRALTSYFAELDRRFDTGFDAEDTILADAANYRRPKGVFLVARRSVVDPAPLACGAVTVLTPGVAEIKRMWVDPVSRGLGLGRRMLADLEEQARRLNCHMVRLDTNSSLTEAIALYTRAGYRAIERYNENPYAKHWFEKPL